MEVSYQYFQPRPKKSATYDSNLRALCAVSGFSWLEMFDKMSQVGREIYANTEDVRVTERILEKWGFERTSFKLNRGDVRPTVEDIVNKHGNDYDIIVCRVRGGFVTVKEGVIYDTFNCYNDKVYFFYARDKFLNPYL